ncbi:MAG: uroporphyrinogen-III synthase [Bacteroidia bacterium]|nr:uroporphyrinogen-III synthase [Bacteroidia bacterium]
MKIRKILISQPEPQTEKSPYFDLATKFNLKIDFKPFIHIEGVSVREFRQQRINIPDYTALIFTSRAAVDHFFRICEEMRITMPDTMKYFCVTESIAFYIQKYVVYRKRKIFYGNNNFADLMEYIIKHKEENFLIPLTDPHKSDMTAILNKQNIKNTIGYFYRTVSSDMTQVNLDDYDIVVFFSPIGIKSLFENFPKFEQKDLCIGTFGPTTAKAALEAGLRLDIQAPSPESPSITAALECFIKKCSKEK